MAQRTVGDETRVKTVSRRLRDLAEPIAACVYFVPEALGAYEELGLGYAPGYFCSRGACLGHPSGEVVAAAFGVFKASLVRDAVAAGWAATDPPTILAARERGATAALRRMLGDIDPVPAVAILRPVLEAQEVAGRALFAGLRSLPFPTDPLAQLWRVCDWVREHRGDGHIAAWIAADLDPLEVGLLTELYWGLDAGTYIFTRGWSKEDVDAGYARLEARGLVADRAFTDDGRALRSSVEDATDRMEARVVDALGDRADELFAILQPWTSAVLDGGGYPVDPRLIMNRDTR